jgi:hypothetical protein
VNSDTRFAIDDERARGTGKLTLEDGDQPLELLQQKGRGADSSWIDREPASPLTGQFTGGRPT